MGFHIHTVTQLHTFTVRLQTRGTSMILYILISYISMLHPMHYLLDYTMLAACALRFQTGGRSISYEYSSFKNIIRIIFFLATSLQWGLRYYANLFLSSHSHYFDVLQYDTLSDKIFEHVFQPCGFYISDLQKLSKMSV